MNIIHKKTYLLEMYVWEPQSKLVDEEFDKLAAAIKTKTILAHAGYVRLVQKDDEVFKGVEDDGTTEVK
jgi:hypothetical protein